MKIKIPKPKLPKINVGSKKVAGIPIPTFNVDWFKTGGIATGPSIAGIGEAGSEAIVPLAGRRMLPFSQSIAKQLAGMVGGVGGGNMQIHATLVLPDGRVIAEIAEPHIQTIQDRKQMENNRGWGRFD